MAQQRRKMREQDAEKLLPLLAEFNNMAKELVRLLNHKVAVKEKKVAVYLTGMSLPKNANMNVSVKLIDIRNTDATMKGKGSFNVKMPWERDAMSGPSGVVI